MLRWLGLLGATWVVWSLVIAGVLANVVAPIPVVYAAAAIAAVVWLALFAFAVFGLRGTDAWPLMRHVVGPSGLAILAVLVIVIASLTLLEVRKPISQDTFARLFAGGDYVPAPYVMFHALPNERREIPNDPQSHGRTTGHVSTNSEGFRGPEWPASLKPAGQLRLAVLGGSSVFLGLTDDRTLPALVAAELARRLGGADVMPINGGILAGNSTQELILLATRIVDLSPDIVLVLDGFNDVNGPLNYDARVGYPYNFIVTEAAWRDYTSTEPAFQRLLGQSRTIERIREILGGTSSRSVNGFVLGTPQNDASIQAMAAAAANLHAANWRKIGQLCTANRIDCLLGLQPTLLYPSTGAGNESVNTKAYRLFYEQTIAEIGRPGAFPGATATTFTDMFGSDAASAFGDAVHLYDEANARFAARIADALCGAAPRLAGRCR